MSCTSDVRRLHAPSGPRRRAAGHRLVVLLACALIFRANAAAQQPAPHPHRGGLWGDFGWGLGSATLRCSGCEALPSDHWFRGGRSDVLRLAIGYALRHDLLVAFRGGGWSTLGDHSGPITPADTVAGTQQLAASLWQRAAALRYFPADRRLWIEATLGLGNASISRSRHDPHCTPAPYQYCHLDETVSERSGVSFGGSVGYDFPVWRLWLSPYAGYTRMSAAGKDTGSHPEIAQLHGSAGFLEIGLAVTGY